MPSSDVLNQLAGARSQEEVEVLIDQNTEWLTERLRRRKGRQNQRRQTDEPNASWSFLDPSFFGEYQVHN